ncbi:MAG: hypothetical protein E6J90_01485 [Deltaproteobacteria bacterium]|nr:MAG: hypothetical protein E6J90_01485 [Deltaproteobacteria bacterium]
MTKVTFYGLPAWVGAIHGPTVCEWWDRDPSQLSWDRTQLHQLDLSKTPSAALAGRIPVADVEVDDHRTNGGRTTLGPRWPGGAMVGACWVSEGYLTRNGLTPPGARPGPGGHGHEFTFVQYFDGEQGNRRFYGMQANLLQQQHNLSLVQIWHPGTGAGAAHPAGTFWLDLNSDADPSTSPLSPNQPAPLYLDASAASNLAMIDPKLPPYSGSFVFSRQP